MSGGIRLVVIGGPTASGKTRLSIAAAKRFGGEIVSADSMQIYRGMDIGTAKPDAAEQAGVRHTMLDECSPDTAYSVADYCTRAKQYIADMAQRGVLPIVAGGTGLYISSLVDNVQFAEGKTDLAYRAELWELARSKGNQYVHDMLAAVDAPAARATHPNNVKRVIRALECYHCTGITKTEQDARSKLQPSPYEPYMAALEMDRPLLYERIDMRVEDMLARGLVEEVRQLSEAGLTLQNISMQGIGYKEVLGYLEGQYPLAQCAELIKKNTRNYAKRQLTWFRRDKRYVWYNASDPALDDIFLRDVERFLQGKNV